jgi:hypothetical protein
VIHQRRHPIPGLYASGNVAAATEHGVGYQAGLSLASKTYNALDDEFACAAANAMRLRISFEPVLPTR